MASSVLAQFYAGRVVLVTGGTGFIGKQLVEKLLRSCPDISTIYVLLRASRSESPASRMQRILASTLFDRVRGEQGGVDLGARVGVIEGDISLPGLGLSVADREKLCREVTVVFHLAATVSFDEPMKVAVSLNVFALRSVVELCKQMSQLEALVHVSTAYAQCQLTHVDERVYPPPLTPTQILDAAQWMSEGVWAEITTRVISPRPNTYTFTKAIAEQLLLDEHGEVPTAIFRPSIVTASLHEPVPGWVDNLNGCTGVLTAIGSGLLQAMYGAPSKMADLVPVDLVANALIAVAWRTATLREKKEVTVYNFTSGHIAPHLDWNFVGSKCSESFRRNPLENHAWIPKGYVTSNRVLTLYSIYIEVYLRMAGIDLMRRLLGKRPRMLRIHRSVRKMTHMMEYFTSHDWVWAGDNMARLALALPEHDKQTFNFDVRPIHWGTYIENYCLGIRQHIMHQRLSTLPHARRLLRGLQMFQRVVTLATLLLAVRLIIRRSETASRLWRFIISMLTALLQHTPRALRAP